MMLYDRRQGAMSNLPARQNTAGPAGYIEATTGSIPPWLLLLVGGYIVYRLLKK